MSPTSARCLLDFVFLFIMTHGCSPRHSTNCIFCNLFYYMRVNVAPIKSEPCYLLSRYASLYFCLAIENQENELLALEVIHRYVELLDKYFGNVH